MSGCRTPAGKEGERDSVGAHTGEPDTLDSWTDTADSAADVDTDTDSDSETDADTDTDTDTDVDIDTGGDTGLPTEPCAPVSVGAMATRWCAEDDNDYFAERVSLSPDLTGDGRVDVIVSATIHENRSGGYGAIYLLDDPLAGGDTSVIPRITHDEGGITDSFGFQVAADGDLDGDGYADLVSADHDGWWTTCLGTGFVFSGPITANRGSITADARFTAYPMDIGFPIMSVPDVDGDGDDELVIGGAYPAGNAQAFLLLGPITADDVDNTAVLTLSSADVGVVGPAVIGDLDGDGASDIVSMEAYGEALYIVPASARGEQDPTDFTVLEPTAVRAFTSSYSPEVDVGDYDSDGYQDLLLLGEDSFSAPAGQSRAVLFAGPFTESATLDSTVAQFAGSGAYGAQDATFAGDLDGDGTGPDVAITDCAYPCDSAEDYEMDVIVYPHGQSGVLTTADAATLITSHDEPGPFFPYPLVSAGDLDGDGDSELLAGSYEDDESGDLGGSLWIFHGGSW